MKEQPPQPLQSAPSKKVNPFITGLIALGVVAVAVLVVKFFVDRAIPDVPGVVLNDLNSIDDLRARFNADKGTPRLVMLLSPT